MTKIDTSNKIVGYCILDSVNLDKSLRTGGYQSSSKLYSSAGRAKAALTLRQNLSKFNDEKLQNYKVYPVKVKIDG